jgi:lipoprotein-releasing system ATP-binding protein
MSDAANQEELALRVEGVTRAYTLPNGSRLDVLQGVDLEVARGDFVLVEGLSGIGKSTLLHIMGLLDRPDQGRVEFSGRDYAQASKGARARARATQVGFVFQFFHLLPEFTALENVMMSGMVRDGVFAWRRHRAEARERAEGLLEAVGVGERARHRPNQLSGGERQRVALARGLFNEPAVLLCDEPTGNLDVRTSQQIHELLVELNETLGQTMVVVTHDPRLRRRASRTVRLDEGRAVPVDHDGEPITAAALGAASGGPEDEAPESAQD